MRAFRTLIISTGVILALAAASVRRRASRSSSAARPQCCRWPRNSRAPTTRHIPHSPKPKVSGGQSDIGISGANEGRFDIGDSSRNPIKGVDPHGLFFYKIARDGVCIVTSPKNPLKTSRRNRSKRSSPADAATGARSRAQDLRPDRPVRPRRRLGYPGRLPAHLPRRKPADLPERDRQDLQRPGAAERVGATSRRSASSPSPTPPGSTLSPTTASPATCATPAPDNTPACVTSGWSPRAPPRAQRRSSSAG